MNVKFWKFVKVLMFYLSEWFIHATKYSKGVFYEQQKNAINYKIILVFFILFTTYVLSIIQFKKNGSVLILN